MCDHLSEGRFEFGCGRGAGSWEVGTFNLDTAETKAVWDEVIWEFKKMWERQDYSHDGTAFSTPGRNILPKPYGGGRTHPPMWVAAGNMPTYEKAARHGLGVLGFTVGAINEMGGPIGAYKKADRRGRPGGPVRQRQRDDHHAPSVCADTEQGGAGDRLRVGPPERLPHLPRVPLPRHLPDARGRASRGPRRLPEPTIEEIEMAIEHGALLAGTPGQVCDQLRIWEPMGMDQLVVRHAASGRRREQLMQTIQLFGDEVIPEFDKDPVHRSTRMRRGEVPVG